MSVGTMVTLEEYLNTAYSPDREYVDGVVVERNVGERGHSIVQTRLPILLNRDFPEVFVWTEWRSRTLQTRCRIPYVCVTLHDPGTEILEEPPFLVIEILSRRDEMSDVIEKLEEYDSVGIPNIWVFDPRRKRAFIFANRCLQEVAGAAISTSDPVITVALEELFRGL